MSAAWRIDRLSTEWVGPITVKDGASTVTGWKLALLPSGTRPVDAASIAETPSALGGGLGVLVGPGTSHILTPGRYVLWIRYSANPEAPVLTAGAIDIV